MLANEGRCQVKMVHGSLFKKTATSVPENKSPVERHPKEQSHRQLPRCGRLELPWAPNDIIGYCGSRDDLWLVRRDLKPARTYLKVELEFIDQATAGQPDEAAARTFRAIDRLKAKFGGWVVGVKPGGDGQTPDGIAVARDPGHAGGVEDVVAVGQRAETEPKPGGLDPVEAAELKELEARATRAIPHLERADVDGEKRRHWVASFEAILARIVELRGKTEFCGFCLTTTLVDYI